MSQNEPLLCCGSCAALVTDVQMPLLIGAYVANFWTIVVVS